MYFDQQFDAFVLENKNNDEALSKTLDVLLFRSSTSSKFNLISDKLDDFWQSHFIDNLIAEQMSSENFILALSQYIRSKSIDKNIVTKLLERNPNSVVKAVRQSGIIAQSDHCSWAVLNEINSQIDLLELNDFLCTAEYIQLQYQERLSAYKDLKNQLQLDQITAMVFSSFYAYEYLMNDADYLKIPYQMDINDTVSVQDIWAVFHEVITSSNIDKKKLTEKKLAQVLKAKIMPFLIGENLNHALIKQYDDFKRLVAHKVEINSYQDQVISAYCYQFSTNYYLENGHLVLESKPRDLDSFQEKFGVLSAYWQWRGINTLTENPYFERLDRGKNIESNALALAKTQGIILQLYEIYGIEKAVFEQDYDLYSLIFTMLLSQAHYVQDFVTAFKKIRDSNDQHVFSTLTKLMIDGLLIGQNRMPITFSTHKEKAIKMSDWIIEGGKNKRVREMSRILDFWSIDLRGGSDSSYVENSFYKIDDYIFALPWMLAQKNFNTATINTFRKLYKNRAGLKFETDLMEQNLAGLLAKYKGKVYSQYEPSESGVGEIDAIVVTDNKVLIIELKSTYVKSSVKEIYEYRNFILKKAAYQLSRKSSYVSDIFLPSLGLDSSKFSIHSWIIDTTLEFDHEYIDGFLKISFEELIIILNGHRQYFSDMLKNNDNKGASGTLEGSLDAVIDIIEDNKFWLDNLPLMSSIQELNPASTLKA
ncbi:MULTISPECIES: hypothetical protein [Psychrobacter]|uniref:hypothetical protein n=1 Tax=Psychrobacter TaxID=497 RepID=UPI000EC42B84|nr:MULTISPECIES: hypothetical protein [Psychrobacter]HCH27352.1 hypothetical protein [Psychrobacter sp.]